jgi:hypothetical protein
MEFSRSREERSDEPNVGWNELLGITAPLLG